MYQQSGTGLSGRMRTGIESVEAWARLHSATVGKLLLPTTDNVTVGRRGFYYTSLPSYLELFAITYDGQ